MPRITTVQAAHSYGVLDPLVIERRDTKFIGGSLSDGNNIILLPQGGYTDRGGTTDFGRVRRRLTNIALNSTILSLPNGGSESDLLAGVAVTTSAASTTRFVLFECDFGAPTLVHMIDIGGVSIATTAADNALIAEYWNGAAWVTLGAPAKITLSSLSRRFASGAPGHAGISASQFRVAVDATAAAGAVTFSSIALKVESATLADAIVRRYAPEQGMAHQMIYSPGNIDVYEGGVWRAAIAIPTTEAILREVKLEPKYDTILAWHTNQRPQKIVRLDASADWACDGVVFDNIPRVDYGGVYTNGVNEVQAISLFGLSNPGEAFELTLEGLTTQQILTGADAAATAANIKSALEALSNVEPGLTVTGSGGGPGTSFTVEFSGAGNENREWLQMAGTALDDNGFVRVSTYTQGKAPGEDMISDARGWPSVGRYAQQRLVMAGMKARPNEILASVTGSPFDLNTELDVATAAFSYEITGQENNAIRDMVVSRTILFFGDQQVAYLKNQTLSANEVPQFGTSDAPGIKRTVSPVSSDNAIFYFEEDGPLRQMNYTAIEEDYVSDNASVLSAHLIRDPLDAARRRALGAVDSDLHISINADGTATALTIMRTQEVSGFAPWSTDGSFSSVCVDHDNQVWFIVKRMVDGVLQSRLELMEPDKLLDEAVELTLGVASSVLAGLSRFNGRDVWAVANDSLYGPFTVSGGQIDIGEITSSARVGTWPTPTATDPAVSLSEESRQRHARLKRVNRAVISVHETTSLAIRANDGPIINLPLRSNADTTADEGPLARPLTGKVEAEGMHGFTDHGSLTVTQTFPGHLTVRSVTKNVVA